MACSQFGMSATGTFYCNDKNMRTRKIIPYRTILITGLWLVRKINVLLWVCKPGKVYILHARHTFPFVVYIFFKCKIFYSLNIFIVWKGVLVPPFFFQPSPLLISSLSLETSTPLFDNHQRKILWFYDDILESGRLKTISIKPWKPITYGNCVS